MIRITSSCFFAVLLLSVTACGTKQQTTKEPSQPLQVIGTLNPITLASQKQGIKNCLQRIEQVSSFLTATAIEKGVMLSVSPKAPDKQLVSIDFETKSPTDFSFSSATFAPSDTAKCSATYESIMYWGNDCNEVATKVFAQFQHKGFIRKHIAVLRGEQPQTRIYLMPAGKGCVSIKKENIF